MFVPRAASIAAEIVTKGAQKTMSQLSLPATIGLPLMNATASEGVKFIFQFPAITVLLFEGSYASNLP